MQTLASSKQQQSWLSWFLKGVLILGLFVLIARLVDLQIIKGGYYRKLAEGNRIERVKIVASRGRILARGGEVLSGPNFAHITGYIAETNEQEVGMVDPKCIEKGPMKLGQIVGRSGLQEYYNCHLSGVDGEELIEIDSFGNKLRTIGIKYPISGQDLNTNINYDLQVELANNFEGLTGSAVATDKNGEVLALFSSPTFDPSNIVESLDDPELPLFNRVIGGIYHPGSIFKPLVSIAALEEGKINRNFRYVDTGIVTVESPYGNYSYTNWYLTQYGGQEGEIDLAKALARSTDTFFYKIGEAVGIDNLVEWMKRFGLSKLTNIDVRGEVYSLVPYPEWKQKIKGERWFLGNTYHFSIGQGDLALTTVGIHRANLVISNMGKLCDLKIVGDTECTALKIKPDNLKYVQEGMEMTCQTGGTAFTFFDFAEKHYGLESACKTGTAETNEDGKNHAWFTVFAPIENPEVHLTVMVEKSGEGSKVAGPIARKVMDKYFEGYIKYE